MSSRHWHPGLLLRDNILPALDLTVTQAARDLLVTRQTLHRILAGHASITPEMAIRLERFCGVSSRFWLHRQQMVELERAANASQRVLPQIPTYTLPMGVLKSMGIFDE